MTRKNYILVLLSSLLIITSIIFAGTEIISITAHSESDNMVIEWQTKDEINIKAFVVQRKTPNSVYVDIANLAPQGSYSLYRYVDQGVYKTTSKLYIYRIKIDDGSSNPGYAGPVSATMDRVSDVKRTWGSIKALFR